MTLTNFNVNDVKVLHVEPTTACNAACPQCSRELSHLYNDNIHRNNLTVEKILDVLNHKFIKNLDKMFMCGDFGDPAASNETLPIFKLFRSINPTIELGLNTNGGIQNVNWWRELGKLLNQPTDFCVFSIDGLQDTNHIYRKNVRFDKVVNNAKSFINAGGSAHWDMLVFEHNEHQIDECLELARNLGFTWFRAKISKRFQTVPVAGLNPPKNFNSPDLVYTNNIKCHALNEKSMYLTATGELYPCCWIGNQVFSKDETLDKIINSENFNLLTNTWNTNPYSTCVRNCSVTEQNLSNFEKQWFRNEQLR
jgi:hypothetical protein